jgi:hypothetical protein
MSVEKLDIMRETAASIEVTTLSIQRGNKMAEAVALPRITRRRAKNTRREEAPAARANQRRRNKRRNTPRR